MSKVILQKVNEVYYRVHADVDVKHELNEFFSFRPPGFQFSPAYKNKIWDGKIRIYKMMPSLLYIGLEHYVRSFCEERELELVVQEDGFVSIKEEVPDDYGFQLAEGCKYKPRDYQNDAVVNAIREGRSVMLSPTASGKSFIIYLICKHYFSKGMRALLIVPSTGLVEQMSDDFVDYGFDSCDINKIYGGRSKDSDASLQVSTWQSLQHVDSEWLNQFDVILVDEAHGAKAKVLSSLLEKADRVAHKFGLTGTLGGDSKSHRLALEGLLGKVFTVAKTSDLIKDGTLASLTVKALVLNYTEEERKAVSSLPYEDQRLFLFGHKKRNKFLCGLVSSFKDQNTLVLFDRNEKHGAVMLELFERLLPAMGFTVHYITGGTSDAEDRNRLRYICESSVNNIILANTKIFSTGVNIKRLHNLVFTSATKATITILQSIGRLLRKGGDADEVVAYDVTDNLKWKTKVNYAIEHFLERVKIYQQEKFKMKQFNIDLF